MSNEVAGLFVRSVADVWHQELALEKPADYLSISIRLVTDEVLCALLHDFRPIRWSDLDAQNERRIAAINAVLWFS